MALISSELKFVPAVGYSGDHLHHSAVGERKLKWIEMLAVV